MILTNNLGAVIHKENWAAFITARRPCLAWYGGESLNQLLGEIRKKKDILSKHLAQLHVTETVIHYAEERPIDRVSVTDLGGLAVGDMTPANDPLILAWELLNYLANEEYAVIVEEATRPDSVMDVFEQDEPETGLDPLVDILLHQVVEPPTPESIVGIGGNPDEEYFW